MHPTIGQPLLLLLCTVLVTGLFQTTEAHRSKGCLAFAGPMGKTGKEIYNVPGSGWASPNWNWGYASGTGHDCAMICRDGLSTRDARESFVTELLNSSEHGPPFEEVKLVLGLAWQNGRWDGSDGGRGGYGQVLSAMAAADRYENGDEIECSRLLVEDMKERFHLIAKSEDDIAKMNALDTSADIDPVKRKCAGLVLQCMGFIEKGL
eukprot:scaffold684_cov38-Attheya_sp.AAC.1